MRNLLAANGRWIAQLLEPSPGVSRRYWLGTQLVFLLAFLAVPAAIVAVAFQGCARDRLPVEEADSSDDPQQLAAQLSDEDPDVRFNARLRLLGLGRPGAIAAARVLREGNRDARREAVA